MKTCTKCGVSKNESEFALRSDCSTARQSWCHTCKTAQNLLYYHKNREQVLSLQRQRYQEDPDKKNKKARKWALDHPEQVRKNARKSRKKQYYSDPGYRVEQCLRARLGVALKDCGAKKSARNTELLGAPWIWVEVHLESLFKPGMTWENHGPVWHIDHIRPCASFDLTDPEQQRMCFHWTNLQPLFALDNLRKGDTYDPQTA